MRRLNVITFLVAILGGCMSPEEYAQYQKEQQEERLRQSLAIVDKISDDSQLEMIVLGITEYEMAGYRDWRYASYPEELRLAALKKIKDPWRIAECAVYKTVPESSSPISDWDVRREGDPVRELAIKRLMEQDDAVLLEIGSDFMRKCDLESIGKRFKKNDGRREADVFQVPTLNLLPSEFCYVIIKALHGHKCQKGLCDFLEREEISIFNSILSGTGDYVSLDKDGDKKFKLPAIKNGEYVNISRLAKYFDKMTQEELLHIFEHYYRDRHYDKRRGELEYGDASSLDRYDIPEKITLYRRNKSSFEVGPVENPRFTMLKNLFDRMDETYKSNVIVFAVGQKNTIYPQLSNCLARKYDYATEKRLIKSYRKQILAAHGDNPRTYPEDSLILKFASLLYTPEEFAARRKKIVDRRGEFSGIFGMKFGDTVDTTGGDVVYKFKMHFYRVPVSPVKRSNAFQNYYMWVTMESHRIFAIEGRSTERLDRSVKERLPSVALALEKRYHEYFEGGNGIYRMAFPEEKCRIVLLPDISGNIKSSNFMGLMSYGFLGYDITGSSQDIERLEDYRFEKNTRAFVLAENFDLRELARKESESADKKKKEEADSARQKKAEEAAEGF